MENKLKDCFLCNIVLQQIHDVWFELLVKKGQDLKGKTKS